MDFELRDKCKALAVQLAERNDVLGVNLIENDKLEELNKEYDAKLLEREDYLKDLLLRNEAEISELKFEEASVVDRCSHEMKVKETYLAHLISMKRRFNEIRAENDTLKSELDKIAEVSSKERFASGNFVRSGFVDICYLHVFLAEVLHQMNKSMRVKRQNLEASLKRELVSDYIYLFKHQLIFAVE